MRRLLILLTLSIFTLVGYTQITLNGVVTDRKGNPVFAANVYPMSDPQLGVVTSFAGTFSLKVQNISDTLIVSFVGFEPQHISISKVNPGQMVTITLQEKSLSLGAVTIRAKDPISEKFSVVKMQKMDIYLNPMSQGDPLKAITILPASSNTDETANPSLRGSSADRSRVVLNGVPIYSPVRASQLNNQGFFSLFNTEIVGSQYVYATNPPLTFGNTSAGLVDIQTNKMLESNQIQVSTSLASVGFFLNQKLKGEKSFLQAYTNYQFSNAFVDIQKASLPNIKKFQTLDAGLNFHHQFKGNVELNSYSYLVDEGFNGYSNFLNYKGEVNSGNFRFFTVNNLKHTSPRGVLSLNSGISTSAKGIEFGSMVSNDDITQVYTSIDFKWFATNSIDLQFGLSHDYQVNRFYGKSPIFFYQMSSESPTLLTDTLISNSFVECYAYGSFDISKVVTLSSGVRAGLPQHGNDKYFSYQLGIRYNLTANQNFLLSGGTYNNFSTPSYYQKTFSLLQSNQLALDYSLGLSRCKLNAAFYVKNETGKLFYDSFYPIDGTKTLGIELFIERELSKVMRVTLSNSFIHQTMIVDGKVYSGENKMSYLLKAALIYNNPKLFNLSICYFGHPGKRYTPIASSVYFAQTDSYFPIFSNELQSAQFGSYNRIDIGISRYMSFGKNAVLAFASINNILNFKNQQEIIYNSTFSPSGYDYYSLRTIYFGVVWHFYR